MERPPGDSGSAETIGGGPPDRDALVSQIYATTLSPENYDALMDAIDGFLGENGEQAADPVINNHFQTALDILKRMGRRRRAQARADAIVENAPGPAFICDAAGAVLAMNDLGRARMRSNAPSLRDLQIDAAAREKLEAWMASGGEGLFVEPAVMGALARSNCIIARPVSETPGEDGRSSRFFITTVELQFDRQRAEKFLATYDLTGAELAVAMDLAAGAAPADIAEARAVSINTVRAQVQSIIRKTGVTGIPDLVRLLCGFSAGLAAAASAARVTGAGEMSSPLRRRAMMTLKDGRQLAWLEQGAEDGAPVILFHNMLYGVDWPDAAAAAAQKSRLRIISPSRPGYGASDIAPAAYGDKLLDTVANDTRQLMDHLGLSRAVILGHVVGSVYALRFAGHFPGRTAAILMVSHAPAWREEWLADLPRRQQVVARIARHTPSLLPFITRAGIALIDAGYAEQFVNALHREIPADNQALRRPEIFDLVVRGLDHTNTQGAEGFRRDCMFPITDYTAEARKLGRPIHVIHGAGDMVAPPRTIETFAAALPGTTAEFVRGAGQYLLFSHWRPVIAWLEKAARRMEDAPPP